MHRWQTHHWQTQQGTVRDLRAIATFLADVGAQCQWNEAALYHLQTAVDEACANVFEHAYEGEPGPLVVEVSSGEREVVVRIRDWSDGFELGPPPIPDRTTPLEERPIGGLGLLFIYKMIDEVEYELDGKRGNCLTLRKRL